MWEYGVFNAGTHELLDRGFYDYSSLAHDLAGKLSRPDGVYIARLCDEHDDQQYDTCEDCFREDDSEVCERCRCEVDYVTDGLCDECVAHNEQRVVL